MHAMYKIRQPINRISLGGLRVLTRSKADFRLKPDPNRIPRTRTAEERMKNSQPKTGTIEDFQLYERNVSPNNISSVLKNGFKLDNGAQIISQPEKPLGLLLLGHDAYVLDLSSGVEGLTKGRVELDTANLLGVLDIVHPKPELLVVGLGAKSRILGVTTQKFLRQLGMQMDVSTTRTAASNYDLLANERGQTVAALLLPPHV